MDYNIECLLVPLSGQDEIRKINLLFLNEKEHS